RLDAAKLPRPSLTDPAHQKSGISLKNRVRSTMTNPVVADLLARSNRLGADPKNTNYAGGNTSAKGSEVDPVTGDDVELMWVKGSGGDLGTLREEGLCVLRMDRLRQMERVYPG